MHKKLDIILHIGTEKTGTTTLQESLLNNKERIKNYGYHYAHGESIINARHLASACIPDSMEDDFLTSNNINSPIERKNFRALITTQIRKEIQNLPGFVHTIIFSSEHFHSRLKDTSAIRLLYEILSPHSKKFEIICYIRKQTELAKSLYSTALRLGWTMPLYEFMDHTLNPHDPYCNYQALLSSWASVFQESSIKVRLFERDQLFLGDITNDFLTTINAPLGMIDSPAANTNESISHLGQILLRKINELHLHEAASVKREELLKLRDRVSNAFTGKGENLSTQEEENLQHRFINSNEAVRLRWFPDQPELFSSTDKKNHANEISPYQEELIKHILKLAQ